MALDSQQTGSTTILVLGTKASMGIVDALFELGFEPIIRSRTEGLLRKLRRERSEAVVVDAENCSDDLLEFLLNVRDIDQRTPVIVLGDASGAGVEDDLLTVRQAFILGRFADTDELAHKLKRVIRIPEMEDG